MIFPKFIIGINQDGEKILVMGDVEYHKALAVYATPTNAGWWFIKNDEIIFHGEYEDYGRASELDIQKVIQNDRVFKVNEGLLEKVSCNNTFKYMRPFGTIINLQTSI